ncbi:MAG: hypothetical protein IIC73_05515 [Armatimonadetes bacterium]|nr:hypothetical protein [Armatimonadota bacterium]
MTDPAAVLTELREAFAAKRKWRALEKAERKLEKAMQTAFRTQGRAFMAKLDRKAGLQEAAGDILPPDWEAIFDAAASDTAIFTKPIQAGIESALLNGGTHAISDFAVEGSFDLANPRAVAYLENHAADAVTAINETTRSELRTIITNGVDKGKSYDAIAREIRERFDGFSTPSPLKHIRSRAHLVAVTEVGDAYEAGNRAVIDGLVDDGLTMQKSWSTTGDSRVDPICDGNEGEGWIPVEDTFSSGDGEPLAHPGCRCGNLYRRKPSRAA